MKLEFTKKELDILRSGETIAKAVKLDPQPEKTDFLEHRKKNVWAFLSDEDQVWKQYRMPWVVGGTVKVYGTEMRPKIKNLIVEKEKKTWFVNLILEL